ncbi:ROK family protein [Psychrilyobacter atlanticus]|uniref:ROK family protein n=1 Tax=Psychrilyobacter atlanticus TaxID=271091 RepID=UPI000420036E|nr:ROK family protein [Psychrilyobacter atlanticus]
MKYLFGVDLGGTNTKIGLLNIEGEILLKKSIKTNSQAGFDECFNKISEVIKKMNIEKNIDNKDILGIGMGIPGPVLHQEIVSFFANFPWKKNLNVAKILEEKTGYRVKVDNDVNVITLGEIWQGSAKGYNDVIGMALGTGIGGGIVTDGKLVGGAKGAGGEIGHMTIVPNGKLCGCGKKGCFEAYVSATGIEREAESRLIVNKNNKLWDIISSKEGQKIEAKDVFDAAKLGDSFSLDIVDYITEYIAYGLSVLLHVTNPEVVVIGGGVALAGNILFDGVRKKIKKYSLQACTDDLQILPAKLGNEAGIIGAAALIVNC